MREIFASESARDVLKEVDQGTRMIFASESAREILEHADQG